MIYIPSYFDYVSIRNFLKKKQKNKQLSFVQCTEYSSSKDISRNRTHFNLGKTDWMLYTERFHFFHRFNIRGIKKILFYSPPVFPHYYPEILNLIPEDGSAITLFTKYDIYQLQPIIGIERCEQILLSDNDSHLFC